MSDTIDPAAIRALCRALADSLDVEPLGLHAAVLVSSDDPTPLRMTQTDLVDRFEGMPVVQKRLRRVLIPRGCVLLVLVEDDVRVGVVRLDDPEPREEPEAEPARACAVGVLGTLGMLAGNGGR